MPEPAGPCIEISRRNAVEAERDRAADLLRQAIDALPDGFVIHDETDRILMWNRRLEELSRSMSVEHLIALIDESLDLARSETGGITLYPAPPVSPIWPNGSAPRRRPWRRARASTSTCSATPARLGGGRGGAPVRTLRAGEPADLGTLR